MIEIKTVSQCISYDYCKWWNDAVKSIGRCGECNHYRFVFSLDKENGMRCIREKNTRETKETDCCSYFESKEREEK